METKTILCSCAAYLFKSWQIFRNQQTILCQIMAKISKLWFCLIDIKLYCVVYQSRRPNRNLLHHTSGETFQISGISALQLEIPLIWLSYRKPEQQICNCNITEGPHGTYFRFWTSESLFFP